jgi:GTP-binding protein
VEEPTVRMTFGVNTSPFAGKEGKAGWGTSRRLRERLLAEVRHNVALRVEDGESSERFTVSGRGELHLGILIETMRREGYEFEVSKPEVIYHEDPATGQMMEPVEEVHIEVAEDSSGIVFEMMGERKGKMLNMRNQHGTTYLTYLAPTRFLLGFQPQFLRATSGMGQFHSLFYDFEPVIKEMPPQRSFGSLVAMETGTATGYALSHLQARGSFFIEAGVDVYAGMVVGEHIRSEDLDVNLTKSKGLSAVRTKNYADEVRVKAARNMSLDDWIEFMADDELLEVTPESLRLRKRILNAEKRIKERKSKEKILSS